MVVAEEDDVMRRLEARHYQPTNQRRAILQALMKHHAYVAPRDLYAALHDQQPAIGQATVYRTLELLVEVGAATRFLQENNESKYIYCSPRHHHHLVCTRCGLVEDIDGCLLPPISPALEQSTRFKINDHAITLYGYCGTCRVSGVAGS
jgi:Fur family ferric uptake transcriptional regulator